MSNVLVITPSTGSHELVDAITSVLNQTTEVDHLIVCDGNKFKEDVLHIVDKVIEHPRVTACYLPYNTGGGGFYGHRIMAAFSHLVNHDYILFLDQDNWFEPNHVKSMVDLIEKQNLDWVYSLRKIFNKNRDYLCDDNCESLGRWPVWVNDQAYLIDSSSYCFKTSFFRQVGHLWDYGWGADRRFYTILKDHIKHQNYACTGQHTLGYRLGGNEGSVQKEFFDEGNQKMKNKYSSLGIFPWHQSL